MRRYTIHFRFGQDFLPMINCTTLEDVANKLTKDDDRPGFKVFDNIKEDWISPERIFLACVLCTKGES